MVKQTAVQYLRSEIKDKDNGEIPIWVYIFIEQAIFKEKEQIELANYDGYVQGIMQENHDEHIQTAEEYYYETYSK